MVVENRGGREPALAIGPALLEGARIVGLDVLGTEFREGYPAQDRHQVATDEALVLDKRGGRGIGPGVVPKPPLDVLPEEHLAGWLVDPRIPLVEKLDKESLSFPPGAPDGAPELTALPSLRVMAQVYHHCPGVLAPFVDVAWHGQPPFLCRCCRLRKRAPQRLPVLPVHSGDGGQKRCRRSVCTKRAPHSSQRASW